MTTQSMTTGTKQACKAGDPCSSRSEQVHVFGEIRDEPPSGFAVLFGCVAGGNHIS